MIIFDDKNKIFRLKTRNTEYAMRIVHEKYVVHLYYGGKNHCRGDACKEKIVDFAPYIAEVGESFSLDTIPTELSFFDSGDTKDVAVKIKNANGDATTLFYYKTYRVFEGREELKDLPHSRGGDQTLELIYFDEVSACVLRSYYTIFEECDTIVRYAKFENSGKNTVYIEQASACQLDIAGGDYSLVTLAGDYCCERNIAESPVHVGIQGIYSKRGHSSHRSNPFLALKEKSASENKGEAYAFEFVYSGDFEARVEKSFSGKLRVLMGLNRDTFSWCLESGETFYTPETILTYSAEGMNKLSQNLHDHIRGHIMPPRFAYAERPVVINTWEAMHFNFDESKALQYALRAKSLGMDMIVIDDGWYGNRCNDASGLGDWYVNRKKFTEGLAAFSEKVHAIGLKLGIWIEPEMISPNSDLYKKHPDWVLCSRGRKASFGRKQLVLDLANDEVVDYIVNALKRTLFGVKFEYIKWDFNRCLSEAGSAVLPAERQSETKHRFMLGSYRMHRLLTEAFPDVLFEGCSGGGGRFDAGMLYYCPQIWASDNTDPVCRLPIQKGTLLAYPPSALSAHVTVTRYNKLETSPDLSFRFNVACDGILGYEMDITRLDAGQETQIRDQIVRYKAIQHLLLGGDVYIPSDLQNGEYATLIVAKDKSEFVLLYRNTGAEKRDRLPLCGLKPSAEYEDAAGNRIKGDSLEFSNVCIQNKSDYSFLTFYGKII